MGKLLEALANDNLRSGPLFIQEDSAYGKARSRLLTVQNEFLSRLNETERELYHKLDDALGELTYLSTTDKFISGYRLGVLMTIEVFAGSDTFIANEEGE